MLVYKHSVEVSHMTIQHILATKRYTKVCVTWVPKQVTDENKHTQVYTVWKCLAQRTRDPTMISHTVTGDESWILYIIPARKEDTRVGIKKGGWPKAKKKFVSIVLQKNSLYSILGILFWDCHWALSIDFQDGGDNLVILEDLKKN